MSTKRPLVLRGGRLLDAASHDAPHRDILIMDSRIAEIGAPGLAVPDEAEEQSADGFMLMPGMVNAHTHGHGSFGKGRGDLWSLELLLNAGPWISAGRNDEDKYLATLLNAAEMIRRGATAVYDLTWEQPQPSVAGMHAVARAYDTAGMRALITPMMADLSFYQVVPGLRDSLPDALRKEADKLALDPYQAAIDACAEVLRTWPFDTERLRFGIAPTIPMHCTDEFLAACRRLSDEFVCPVHTHMAESKLQALVGKERYGMSLTAKFDELGLLTDRFTAAHGVWLDADDMKRMADKGASVAHNPASNLRLGSGIAPVRRMLDAGINVAVGTDGSNSSDNQNMFEATRLAAYLSRVTGHDLKRWISSAEAFEMATAGGARAMGMQDLIGRIAPGYAADIVFVDLNDFSYVPLNDPVNQVVYADDGASVHSVMVAGDFVYENRRFTGFDEAKLRLEVANAMDRLNRILADRRDLVLALEPLVADHCICFSSRSHHTRRIVDFESSACD
jgi:guanine deaminase